MVSGECCARLTKVGEESYGVKLTAEAKTIARHKKPGMMKSLTRLLYIIGVFIVPIGILLFLRRYEMLGLEMKESVENTAAAIIGMIPEGLYLLVSVALAVSVRRLAQKKILVQDLKSTGTLARVDVLCVDKTGTVTEPGMEVSRIIKQAEGMNEEALTQSHAPGGGKRQEGHQQYIPAVFSITRRNLGSMLILGEKY